MGGRGSGQSEAVSSQGKHQPTMKRRRCKSYRLSQSHVVQGGFEITELQMDPCLASAKMKEFSSFVYDNEICQLLAAPIYFREDMGIEELADGINFHCGKTTWLTAIFDRIEEEMPYGFTILFIKGNHIVLSNQRDT
ncbi:hypothetical protein STEG23_009473, partial [Scotinomys teguina]